MPLLRFSRDKRGYEHFYLVQSGANRRGKPSEHRILYWYRTPPNVKVGREPFDEETQRLVEAQNPGVEFDWEKFRNTPFPPPQPEHWRERRQAAKAARRLQREEAEAEPATSAEDARPGEEAAPVEEELPETVLNEATLSLSAEEPSASVASPATESAQARAFGQRHRRRRRRGRRGRKPENGPAGGAPQTESGPISSSEPDELSGGGSSFEDPDVPDVE